MLLMQVAAVEMEKTANANWLSATIDIAALVTAFIWPLFLICVLILYRKDIPFLVKGISSRISKLEFGGFSIELAKARQFDPEWSEAAGALDLRHKAQAGQVNDSYMMTFRDQLLEEGSWDYVEVNLGSGREWLTSRLFIMSIVFQRMKGIKAIVFLKQSARLQRIFTCWAEPQKVRWALAKRYPWLEQAYYEANAALANYSAVIVTNEGRLGTRFDASDPEPSISLIREFLMRVQAPVIPAPERVEDWINVSAAPPTYEHAGWLSSIEVQDILGQDCNRSSLVSQQLDKVNGSQQMRTLLGVSGDFVAVTSKDHEFEYLIDRTIVLEQVAGRVASQFD